MIFLQGNCLEGDSMTEKYTSAVAFIRTMENSLLTYPELEQLINTNNKKEFDAILLSKKNDLPEVWKTIRSFAPDSHELEIMLYRNDFNNLKAVLKTMISGKEPDNYFIEPSNISLETFKEAFETKNSDILPDYIRETAENAYELITRTLDGQLMDIIIDSKTLEAMQHDAQKFGGEFIKKYIEIITVCTDIKISYRCSKIKSSRDFMEMALVENNELDKQLLIQNALAGTDILIDFLEHTPYNNLALILRDNPAEFEKYCDNMIIEFAENARMKAFGIEPLIAYFMAKETESKNLRIISVCREIGLDKKQITERLRKTYV